MPDELTIRLWLRVTARISCVLFLAAFAGPGLHALYPSHLTRRIESYRPHFLLTFAGSHTVHLGVIVLLMLVQGPRYFRARGTAIVLVVGGTLFVFIYALAFDALTELRGRTPAILRSGWSQAFCLWALWVIFALAFVPPIAQKPMVYGPFGVAVLAASVIRLAARFRPAPSQASSV
jgi:methionine sulfoxide reductase heme-binding subunit